MTQTADREHGLDKALTRAQVVMIGLGGAIGTGLFMGSGIAIGYAGPAVVLSYAIAGFIALVMVFSLSEMAVVHPAAGSFGVYAETYLNPWAGFVVRYTYWFAQVIAIGGEAVAAGIYMTFWFPGVPVWVWSLAFAFILLYVNARSVSNFGTFEYWFAMIKVTAIVLFIILGAVHILGIGVPAVGFHNLTGAAGRVHAARLGRRLDGGDHGRVLVQRHRGHRRDVGRGPGSGQGHPGSAAHHAAAACSSSTSWRSRSSSTFVPWTETGAKVVEQSPFVRVFAQSGVAYAAGIMNFVVMSAALSSMNTNVYLCSRMLFSLSRGNYAPQFLGKLGKTQTPIAAIIVSGVCILIAAGVSMFTPHAYNYLFGVALFGAMTVWIFILLSHLSFRRRHTAIELPVRMPLFPWMQLAALGLLIAVLVTMGLDQEFWNISWIVGVPWLVLISIAYFVWRPRRASV